MGSCVSTPESASRPVEAGNQQDRGAEPPHEDVSGTDREASEDKAPQVKILLLGSGDSGKTTILKQLRLLYNGPFCAQDVESYRQLIFGNLTNGMRALLSAMLPMGEQVSPKNSSHVATESEWHGRDIGGHPAFPREYAEALKALWADRNVQRAWKRGHEAALPENLGYFFSSLDRIVDPNYCPTAQDIMQCSVRTTGIAETTFMWGDREVVVADTGGQRSERKKWGHCIKPGADGVLFVASLNSYDQCLTEAENVNQMKEALTLWDSICRSQWLERAHFVLFLNKADLFKKKVKVSNISDHFPDFDGPPNDAQAGCKYFRRRFVQIAERAGRVNERAVHVHFTAGTDTERLRAAMTAVEEIFLQSGTVETDKLR